MTYLVTSTSHSSSSKMGRAEKISWDAITIEMEIHSGRSPWSNAYIPESPGAPTPSSKLRQLEVSLNSAFVTYKEMYFEGGVSSVYLWDLEEQQGRELAFAGVVLLKKSESESPCLPF
jgi:capping protein beta